MFVEILRFLRRKEGSFYKEKRLVLTCGWCARQYIFVPWSVTSWRQRIKFNSCFYCYDNHLKFYTKKYIRLRLNDYCSIIFSIPSQRLFNKIHSTFLREIVNYYTCSFLEDSKELNCTLKRVTKQIFSSPLSPSGPPLRAK